MSSHPGAPRLSPLEPPVSPLPVGAEPPPAPAPLLRAAPEPVKAPPAPQVSLEAQLLRFRIIAPDQMSEAMRVEAETGTPVATTVVERGWVSAEDLAKVTASLGGEESEPEPKPAPEAAPPVVAAPPPPSPPAPVAVAPPPPPPPAPEPELPPAAAVAPSPPRAPEAAPPAPAPVPEPPPAPEAPPPPPEPRTGRSTRVMVRLRNGELLEAGVYDDPQPARERAKELIATLQAEDSWPFVAGRYVAPEEIDSIFLEKR